MDEFSLYMSPGLERRKPSWKTSKSYPNRKFLTFGLILKVRGHSRA